MVTFAALMPQLQVLYLSYTGMTDPLGESQVLAYLKGIAAAKGIRYTIISFERAARYAAGRAQVEAFCKAHGIVWHPLSYTGRPPVLSTFIDVRRMRRLALQLHRQQAFSMVHCRSYISSLTGLRLKQQYGVPFLFDMRGFWADERVDGGLWKLDNPVYKAIYNYFKKKELAFLQQANHVVSLTANARHEILSWHMARPAAPISVIPCCVDLAVFDRSTIGSEQLAALRRQLGIPGGAPVLSYLGSVGTWYLLDEMMAFFAQWRAQKPEALFLFVTNEPERMIFAAAEKAAVPPAVIRVVSAQRAEVPAYLALSDFSVFFIKPAFSKKASSPVKQGELMAMGIPVVCNDNIGDTRPVVEQYHSGVVVPEPVATAYPAAIAAMEQTIFDAAAIRRGAEDFFSLESGVAKYCAVYDAILAPAAA